MADGLELEYEEVLEKVKKMPIEEVQKRYAYILWALQRIDGDPLQWAFAIGQYFRAVRRNYTGILGVLVGVTLEPTKFRIAVDEKRTDYFTKAKIIERKVVEIDTKSCLYWEILSEYKVEEPSEQEQSGSTLQY